MTTQMEKLALDAQYNDVVAAAKALGIEYVGKKKPVLIGMVNDKLDAIANGEVELVVEQPEVHEELEATGTDNGQATGQTPTPAAPVARQPRAPKAPAAPRAKGAKWYEEANANLPYQAGDIIEIHSGEILVGRLAQMTKYSAKKDAIKCILIHPKTGQLQNCEITMDFAKIQMHTPVNPPVVEDQEPVVDLVDKEEVSEEATA